MPTIAPVDVEFPSVCCACHWLINFFEPIEEQSWEGKTKLNAGRKIMGSRRNHGAATRDRQDKTLLVNHSHVTIYSLREMGYFMI